MPSPRKRIGFLPRPVVQKLITEIAKKEKLSQSRVVGILVEEALLARGIVTPQISDNMNKKSSFVINKRINDSFKINNEMNELISDQGVTYTNKTTNHNEKSDIKNRSYLIDEKYDEQLFKKFRDFLEFKRMDESDIP